MSDVAEAGDSVLVTGATGFVGGRLARQLLDRDYEVRVLARTPSDAAELEGRGAEVVEGDLTDAESVRDAVRGVDGVFHLAAVYELGGDLEWMREVNVEGTRRVLDAAAEEGVDRVVYCGSDTSLGDTAGDVRDESATHDGPFRSVYAQTKHEAHELVDERIEQGAPVVHAIVSTVYGPGDESPVADLIEHHLAGRLVAHLDAEAGYTFTHVDDVADALRRAYERGEPGESYLVSGTPATFEEFFAELSEQTGVPEPRFEVPSWVVDAALPVVERLAPLAGGSRSEIREMVGMGRGVTRFFSAEKAEEELGWEPRSLEEGLRETLPAFRKREAESARDLLDWLQYLLIGLAVFDVALGLTALLFPDLYRAIVHPRYEAMHSNGPDYLLARTGILWLVFAAVQGIAAIDPAERPTWVLAAGVLRLLDVPADPVYFALADDLGWMGTAGLLSAPVFNLLTGGLFAHAGLRGIRSQRDRDEP